MGRGPGSRLELGAGARVGAGVGAGTGPQGHAGPQGQGLWVRVSGTGEPRGPCTFRPIARASAAPFSASSESLLAVSAAATIDLRPMALLFTLLCSCAKRPLAWLGVGLGVYRVGMGLPG